MSVDCKRTFTVEFLCLCLHECLLYVCDTQLQILIIIFTVLSNC